MSPTAAPTSARTLGDALWAILDAVPNLLAFRGLVDDAVVVQGAGEDAVVLNHAILYESPGTRSGSRVGATRDRYAGSFQITCVGRDSATCLWVVDRVAGAFTGQLVEVPGRDKPRRVREDDANAAQSVTIDEDVEPPRFYVPLLFRITT